MKKLLLALFLLPLLNLTAIEFKYKWDEDYRIEATVYQNVKFNRRIILSSVIENRYIVKVLEGGADEAKLYVTQAVFQDSAGLTEGYYINHERESGEIYQNRLGLVEPITNEFFPTVQSVPSFPDRDVMVGESWTSIGVEHFDLKNSFHIDDTITTQFRVFYTYRGNKVLNGVEVAVIDINYNIYEKITPYLDWADYYPVKITGSSKQTLYWDIQKGRHYMVDDEYSLQFFISNGDLYEFVGGTKSQSWPKNNLNTPNFTKLVDQLKATPNTQVEEDADQLRITFKSLLFGPESWLLKESVKNYLDSIGSRLSEYKDINIRINGHTALLPDTNKEYVKELSLKRAHSVAEYLVSKGYITKRNIEIVGSGGDFPIDTNSTKEGRESNRRVEIDILKN